MSDYFPADIHIGGPIPWRIVDELIQAVLAEGASPTGFGEENANEAAVREACQGGQVVSLYDNQARSGEFAKLEAFLARQHIHFDRHSTAYAEHNAENVYYRGGKAPLVVPASQAGNDLVYASEVIEILDNESLEDRENLEALRKLAASPQTAELEAIRFV